MNVQNTSIQKDRQRTVITTFICTFYSCWCPKPISGIFDMSYGTPSIISSIFNALKKAIVPHSANHIGSDCVLLVLMGFKNVFVLLQAIVSNSAELFLKTKCW